MSLYEGNSTAEVFDTRHSGMVIRRFRVTLAVTAIFSKLHCPRCGVSVC